MPIPDFENIMSPMLEFLKDKGELSLKELRVLISDKFDLTEEERRKMSKSGIQSIISNRVGWARTYMKKAGFVEYIKRGYCKITERGLEALNTNKKINVGYLRQFPEFLDFQVGKGEHEKNGIREKPEEIETQTPEERLEDAYQEINKDISDKILEYIKENSPEFFERLVVKLLVQMGYGGSLEDAGRAIGKSGDEGIDGIINEDRLGLDVVYIQAKKWENTVGRPEIQKFVGALAGKRAKKGVFITTSSFSSGAIKYVQGIEQKIALIGGEQLAKFMIDFDLGVTKIKSYEIKQIDTDYYIEE